MALSGSGSVAMGSSALSLFLLASWSWCRRATSAFRFSKSFWLNIRRQSWSQNSLDPLPPCSVQYTASQDGGDICNGCPSQRGVLTAPGTACAEGVPSLHLSSICTPKFNLCLPQQTRGSTGQGCSLPLLAGPPTASATSKGSYFQSSLQDLWGSFQKTR